MTFKDMESWKEETYNTVDMYRLWKEFKEEDPFNHSDNFKEEMLNIIMATINGRNDLIITDYTPNEIERLLKKLMR